MANKPDPNVITFGTYEGSPIEWIKIQEENKMVLLERSSCKLAYFAATSRYPKTKTRKYYNVF